MLANSMEPDCQEKFMCLVIAISWSLTIKCNYCIKLHRKINISSTADVQLIKELDEIN